MESTSNSSRPTNNRKSTSHSRKRSWPLVDEERMRVGKRIRQQGCQVPQAGAAIVQHFPETMFQSPQYFPAAFQQNLAWSPQPNTEFDVPLDPATTYGMANIHTASSSSQTFGPYQPQPSQPVYADPASAQQAWIDTTMQHGAYSMPPSDIHFASFEQFVDLDSPPVSDLIYPQDIPYHPIGYGSITQQSISPSYATFNQTFDPNQSHITQQSHQSIHPSPLLFSSTAPPSSETPLEADERCKCGPDCPCEGCGTHFNNAPTRNLVGDLRGILVQDHVVGQYEDHSLDSNQNLTGTNDIYRRHTTVSQASPGNLPSPVDSINEDKVLCEGVDESELTEFAGAIQSEENSQSPPPHYVTVEYSLSIAAEPTPETTDLDAIYSDGNDDGDLFLQSFVIDLPAGELADRYVEEEDNSTSPKGPSSCCRK
ncbi:hypothetical protein MMC11_001307 [Xylographa trunciseda]|nr:hypothetical protein [Xylographa trunciseda]